MKYTSKLIYNNSKDYDQCIWLLFEDNVEYPFNEDVLDEEGYAYEFYTTDVIICEYDSTDL